MIATRDGEGNPTPDNGIKDSEKDTVSIPLEADDDDEPADQPAAAAKGQDRPNSSKSRGNRMRELQERLDKMQGDYAGLQSNIQRMIEDATKPLLERLNQPAAPAATAAKADDPEKQIGEMAERMNSILQEYQAEGLTPAMRQRLTAEYNRLAGDMQKMREKSIEERIRKQLKDELGQQARPENAQAQRILETLEDEFPELWRGVSREESNRRLGKIRAYVEREVEVEERPRSTALYREAAAHLRAKLNLGPTPAPTRDREALAAPVNGRRGSSRPESLEVPVRMMNGMTNATGLNPDILAKYLRKAEG